MNILKPLDVVVALKIGLNEHSLRVKEARGREATSNSVGDLSEGLFKAKGDVSRAINRLLQSGLIGERQPREKDILAANRKYYSVQRNALSDFLVYGVRYAFVPEKSGYGRGVPTGWNCPLIDSPMNPPEVPLVWALPGGNVQGEWIEPLYNRCAEAAEKDPGLYELLSLVEIIRVGKPRELKYAIELIQERVKELYS